MFIYHPTMRVIAVKLISILASSIQYKPSELMISWLC